MKSTTSQGKSLVFTFEQPWKHWKALPPAFCLLEAIRFTGFNQILAKRQFQRSVLGIWAPEYVEGDAAAGATDDYAIVTERSHKLEGLCSSLLVQG